MKVCLCMLVVSLAYILPFGCQKPEKAKVDVWGGFAKSVLKAGKAKDADTLVNKLSMVTIAEGKAFLELLKKSNPQIAVEEDKEKHTDAEVRERTQDDVRLFLNSYEGLFNGELSSIITAQDLSMNGVEIYSMIIWVKQKDGKFRGIKIDNIWKKADGTIEVMLWVQISGYYSDKNVLKKMAVLECDTADACDYPSMMTYKYVLAGNDF